MPRFIDGYDLSRGVQSHSQVSQCLSVTTATPAVPRPALPWSWLLPGASVGLTEHIAAAGPCVPGTCARRPETCLAGQEMPAELAVCGSGERDEPSNRRKPSLEACSGYNTPSVAWRCEEPHFKSPTVCSASPLLSRQIVQFVREWSGLTAMKQRVVRRSGQLFCSPALAFEEATKQQTKPNSTKRYGQSFSFCFVFMTWRG